VIDPLTAYQITSILEGVIQRGTGIAIKVLNRHLAGKTGNDQRSERPLVRRAIRRTSLLACSWAYDHPRSLGDSVQAALYTAPIFATSWAWSSRTT